MDSPLSSLKCCASLWYIQLFLWTVEFSKYRGRVYVVQSREAWEKVNIFPQKYCAVPEIHTYTSENWTYCVFLYPAI